MPSLLSSSSWPRIQRLSDTSTTLKTTTPTRRKRRRLDCFWMLSNYCLFVLLSSPTLFFAVNAEEQQEHKLRSSANTNKQRTARGNNNNNNNNNNLSNRDENGLFLEWCQESLGIETLLEIQTFEYYDYIRAMEDRVDEFCEDCWESSEDDNYDEYIFFENPDHAYSVTDYPTIKVRGLAAMRDIEIGQVVIRIPHASLWTVANSIDNDPVLSKVMGVEAREKYGWNAQYDEIPLLAIALLYHLGLDDDSSFHPYITLLEATPMDSIPHSWDSSKLRHSATVGVRKVAKGIQKDVQDLYETIVMVLVQGHPEVFGPTAIITSSDEEEEPDDSDDEEADWLFSLERFHWAFAIVNSRHWHLPIQIPKEQQQSQEETTTTTTTTEDKINQAEGIQVAHFSEQVAPPAAMPTEDWLDLQRQEHRKEEEGRFEAQQQQHEEEEFDDFWPSGNSFLAPVADLLNFGPPCTRGVYNAETESFEIIATCNFQKGQEVTFWYADACQDVFVANYGFTHPMMVPKCQDSRIHQMEQELIFAVEELDWMDRELDAALHILKECDCVRTTKIMTNETTKQQQQQKPTSAARKATATPTPPKSIHQQQNARHAIRGGKQRRRVASRKLDL